MISDYINYFEKLAKSNVALLAQGDNFFAVIDLDASLKEISYDVPYGCYFFRLIIPSMTINYNNVDQHNESMEGMFMIGRMHNPQDDDDKINALLDVEKLAKQFVNKITQDSRNGLSFIGRSMDNPSFRFDTELVAGDTCYAAIRVLFSMTQIYDICRVEPGDWA